MSSALIRYHDNATTYVLAPSVTFISRRIFSAGRLASSSSKYARRFPEVQAEPREAAQRTKAKVSEPRPDITQAPTLQLRPLARISHTTECIGVANQRRGCRSTSCVTAGHRSRSWRACRFWWSPRILATPIPGWSRNITGIWHRATSLTPSALALHGLVIHRGTIVPLPSGKPAAL